MEYVLPFTSMVRGAALPPLPPPPGLPEFGTHKVADFLNAFTRTLSGYYGPSGVRILPGAGWAEQQASDPAGAARTVAAMHARLHLCNAFKQVIDNGLRLLLIEPLDRM